MNTVNEENTGRYTLAKIATSYRNAFTLFSAIELNLFKTIVDNNNDASIDLLSSDLSIKREPLKAMLNCLVHMDLLRRTSKESYACEKPGQLLADESVANGILNYKSEAPEWINMQEKIKSNADEAPREDAVFNTEQVKTYLDMVKTSNYSRASSLMLHINEYIAPAKKALDLGGGHGLYSEKICELNQDLQVVLADLAPAIAYASEHISPTHKDSIELLTCDARELSIANEFDFVMVNDLLHSFSKETKHTVIKNAIRALKPGGVICISKFKIDQSVIDNNPASCFFSLKMILNTQDGYLAEDDEICELIESCGANVEKSVDIEHFIPSSAILARKGR